MAKTRAKKEVEVGRYAEALGQAKSVVFADLSQLKVADSTDLRRKSKAEKVAIVAAKKTLLRLALKQAGLTGLEGQDLPGAVSMLVGQGDEVAPAKVLEAFRKDHEKVAVIGGLLEAQWMSRDQVKALAALPSKEQLLGQLVGTLNAPISGFVRVLNGVPTGFVRVLNGIKDAKTA